MRLLPTRFCLIRDVFRRLRRSILLMAIGSILLVSYILPSAVQAQNWNNATGIGPWYDVGANWSGGSAPGPTDSAGFHLTDTYQVWFDATTATTTPEVGSIWFSDGNVTLLNRDSAPQHELTVRFSGGSVPDLYFDSASSFTTIRGIHLHALGTAEIADGATLTIDGSHSAGSALTVDDSGATGGLKVDGYLNIEAAGVVSNILGTIGNFSGSTGAATVTGTGSQWNNSGNLVVGLNGDGTLNIESGGVVSNILGGVGGSSGADGTVTVSGTGSHWNNSGDLVISSSGNGTMNVVAGGVVSNINGLLALGLFSTGTVSVDGTGSQWNNAGDLVVGVSWDGTLNIVNDGLVTVGGTTSIGAFGVVNLAGGRLEFGQTTLADFSRINATSGSMAGNLNNAGYTNVATLTALQNTAVDLTDVTLTNSGVLYGNASLGNALINMATGEVETVVGERMRFAGTGNSNAGEINNFGGQIRFEQDLTNASGAMISGRGQFIANGGWLNSGIMAFSAGTTDILGDVNNLAGGQIVTSGGSTTTFFDDVIHNGAEIRTSAGSNTVIFGAATGAGAYTGTGTVFFEGDLRPGNSPAIVTFEGDVVLGLGAETFIEMFGTKPGQFDMLDIAGNFDIDGDLIVELDQAFQLRAGMDFLFADVDGSQSGQFSGLGEGDLVGKFGGTELFITYAAGDGNDVALFTSVPEPNGFALILCATCAIAFVRIRRR